MKNVYLALFVLFCLNSCKSSKPSVTKTSKATEISKKAITASSQINDLNSDSVINSVIDYAKQFDGVRYKYGGTTKHGMDCSGLVTTAFNSEHILLPRSTEDLANTGNWIDLEDVQKGDLLFFATKKNNREVNHVGLVTDTRPGYVEFIHATTSAGVITSNLAERYWHFAFVQARRIL